jgi:MoxR-like ATPase
MAKLGPIPTVSPILSGSEILEARKVVDSIYIDDKVTDYILNIVFATRYPKEFKVEIEGLLEFGASPRASLALELAGKARAFLEGRGYVTPSDIKEMAHAILRHRIRRSYEAEAEDLTTDQIIDRVLNTINVP